MAYFVVNIESNYEGFERTGFLKSKDEKTAFEDTHEIIIDRLYDFMEKDLEEDEKVVPYEINLEVDEINEDYAIEHIGENELELVGETEMFMPIEGTPIVIVID